MKARSHARPLPMVFQTDSETQFKIEKDILLPSRGTGPGRPRKYPMDKMRIGDSFVIPAEQRKPYTASVMRCCAKQAGIKIACRVMDGDLRVWRIA